MGRCERMVRRGDDGFWCLRPWDSYSGISWEAGLIDGVTMMWPMESNQATFLFLLLQVSYRMTWAMAEAGFLFRLCSLFCNVCTDSLVHLLLSSFHSYFMFLKDISFSCLRLYISPVFPLFFLFFHSEQHSNYFLFTLFRYIYIPLTFSQFILAPSLFFVIHTHYSRRSAGNLFFFFCLLYTCWCKKGKGWQCVGTFGYI